MPQINTVKVIAYGAFLWLIITGLIGAVYGFGLYFNSVDSPWIGLVAALVAGGIALIFAKEIGIFSTRQALLSSLAWLVVPVVLDFIIIAPATSTVISSWQYWFGHFLVFLAPWTVFWGGRK